MATSYYRTMVSPSEPFVSNNTAPTESAKEKRKRTIRTRNPDNWKKEKRKRAILSGQAYLNTKGEFVGPRHIGPDCYCKHKCYTSVSEESRNAIFNGYYSLKSYDEQNAYLYGLIRRYDIQRKRKPVSERRTCSYKYYVRVKGREIQVCKKAFANIHGISDKKIRTLCIKHEQNILFPRDNRGRHNNRPKKVTPELVTLIKHHILKMLSGPNGSDFIKTDKNQGPDVNISKLHKAFLHEFEPEAIDSDSDKVLKDFNAKVKSWLYFKVFHEEFNSMDFNTVKRKLSDLRKSLEASGSIQSIKKKGTKTSRSKSAKTSQDCSAQRDSGVAQSVQTHSPGVPIGTTAMGHMTNCQMGYLGSQQQHLPHNLQLSMLSLQHLNNNGHPHAAGHFTSGNQPPSELQQQQQQQQQQQPLNLQTGVGGIQGGGDQSQPLSLNLHSVGGPVSSYYLCFGHVSNLIPIPVSSSGSGQHVGGPQPHSSFPHPQHNMQQFPSSSLLQHHSSVVPHSNINPQQQSNMLQGYPVSQHGHMY